MVTLLVWLLKKAEAVDGWSRVEHCSGAVLLGFEGGGGVHWVSGPGGGFKRVRLIQKNSSTPCWAWIWGSVSATRWKTLRVEDHADRNHADAKARRVHQDDEAYVPVWDRTGVG